MMKAERQEQILKKIEANGRVVVTDYAKELGVTEATLRKDLQELDDRGLVQRVHGGAMKPDTELSRFENRVDLGKDVKMRLAAAAMDEITENRVIFIDGGSTNYLTAQAFPRDYTGTIITNSPAVALWMSDYDGVEVNMLTGVIHHKSKETVGFRRAGHAAGTPLRSGAAWRIVHRSGIWHHHTISGIRRNQAGPHQSRHQSDEPDHTGEIRPCFHIQNR